MVVQTRLLEKTIKCLAEAIRLLHKQKGGKGKVSVILLRTQQKKRKV